MNGWKPITDVPQDIIDNEYPIQVWDGIQQDIAYASWKAEDGTPVWFNGDVVVKATMFKELGPDPTDQIGVYRDPEERTAELLEANTRYLLRARKSEGLLKDLADRVRGEIPTRFLGDVDEHLATPWL